MDRVTAEDVSAAIRRLYGDARDAARLGLGIAGPLPAGERPEAFASSLADDVAEVLAA